MISWHARPTRQQIMVRMLKELRHPGGTHVFWPYALPDDATPGGPDAPSLFWSGAALLRPGPCCCSGPKPATHWGCPKAWFLTVRSALPAVW